MWSYRPVSLRSIDRNDLLRLIAGFLLCAGLYLTSLYSYLLFHTLAEGFSIVIAIALFLIAWNTRQLTTNNYVLFLSIAFLFAGLVDFVHTLAYKGMGIFTDYDANLPTQLWIIARYLQSLSLLAALWFIDRKLNIRAILVFYLSATILLLATVFSGTLFPACFVEGQGLTPFKIVSEYIICFVLIASLVLLLRRRDKFDPHILRLIVWSILFTIVSELAFTFYVSVYGLSNLIGHYFKILAFYLIYRAIIVTGLENPYSLIFHDLEQNRQETQTILDASPIMIFYKDSENRFIRVNKAFAEAMKLAKEGIEGKTALEVFPDQATNYLKDDKEVIASGKPKIGIIEPIDTASGTRWLHTDKIPYRDIDGNIIGIIGFAVDITERRHAEEALHESEKRYRSLFEETHAIMLLIDPDNGTIVDANPAAFTYYGWSREELKRRKIDGINTMTSKEVSAEIQLALSEKRNVFFFKHRRADGTLRDVEVYAGPVPMKGKVLLLSIVHDITDRKRAVEQIEQMAYQDSLTGLPNRKLFSDRLGIALTQAQRNKKEVEIAMLDLDNFKDVNDTLGHAAGDLLLKAAAERLSAALRKGDTVARIGGDEFVLILPELKEAEDAIQVAQKIVDGFRKPFLIDTNQLVVTTSIGIAVYPNDGADGDILLKNADIAMYQAKEAGRDRYQIYNKA